MGRKSKKNKNDSFISIMALIVLSIISLLFSSEGISGNNGEKNTPLETNGQMQVYFFDVGQADSELIINDGETLLIDAGNNEDGQMLVDKIKDMGITKIDHLVGTHAHEDHIGGMDDIIDNFEIGNVYLLEAISNTKTFEDVLDSIANKNLQITIPEIGDTFNVGKILCTVKSVDNNSKDLNNSSIVIQTQYGEKSMLFMGDLEEKMEKNRTWEKVDVLKAGHHGSNTSSSQEFLDQTRPEYAIISCGLNNKYNHPGKSTLDRFNKMGIKIYRTDLDGTIKLATDGTNLNFEKEK